MSELQQTSESEEPTRDRKQRELKTQLNPSVIALTGIPLLWAKNKEQTLRSRTKRSWLQNRCRWIFQVWCRRETGKEMGVKPKAEGAGISNRSK